jgi:hypothetical protein
VNKSARSSWGLDERNSDDQIKGKIDWTDKKIVNLQLAGRRLRKVRTDRDPFMAIPRFPPFALANEAGDNQETKTMNALRKSLAALVLCMLAASPFLLLYKICAMADEERERASQEAQNRFTRVLRQKAHATEGRSLSSSKDS